MDFSNSGQNETIVAKINSDTKLLSHLGDTFLVTKIGLTIYTVYLSMLYHLAIFADIFVVIDIYGFA